jgi:flavodoxin
MKILIAYYSRAGSNYSGGGIVKLPVGNTETAAKMIKQLTGSDEFRVETVKSYSGSYEETTEEAKRELSQNARPELAARVDGMDAYSHIILGYPNWWGTMPMALFTFLEAYDFSGKTIAPFCTNEGSGLGHSESDIKRLCPKATVLKGLAILGSDVKNTEPVIAAWLEKSELIARRSSALPAIGT